MPRSAEKTRRRILEAAYQLFYRKGFGRVGVDEIANLADITKRTLYYHFESKDQLLGAVLEFQHGLALARIRKQLVRRSGSAQQIVTDLFAELAEWSTKPGWTGAGFTRLAMELADMPGHPARVAARRHKVAVEGWWTNVLKGAGVESAKERARELVILLEGTTALILIHGDRSYAQVAAEAAKKLIGHPGVVEIKSLDRSTRRTPTHQRRP
ncbi:MAG TPA: helix-turn-helix domain-containing protein [Bauldia sp.]|nr:helix-turn-helix domain-containing protein [Bauldia sp.]